MSARIGSQGDRPRLRPAKSDTILGRELSHIDESMLRCTRKVSSFDASGYDPRAIENVRAGWVRRAKSEYRSASVFAALVPQLMDARASLEATSVVFRMGQDELRHAAVCLEVIAALGGEPEAEEAISLPKQAAHPGCSAAERALRNVIYGAALTEILNTARFVDSLESTSDPFLRDVTRQLLSDETLHGQFGFLYLDEWRDWLAAHAEVRGSIARYLEHGFAVFERDYAGAGETSVPTQDERALGLVEPERLRETFYGTVSGAIVPGLEQFGIAAEEAWKKRRIRA